MSSSEPDPLVDQPTALGAAQRAKFNAGAALGIAEKLGLPPPSKRTGLSNRFAFFEDRQQVAVVAGAQEGDHVELAAAYLLRIADGRSSTIVLPAGHTNATQQRLPWLRRDIRPRLFVHDGATADAPEPRSRQETIDALIARLGDVSPEAELAEAMAPAHVDDDDQPELWSLVDAMTSDARLDPGHRKGERSWHFAGQRVFSIRRTRLGIQITAGIHYGATRAPTPVVVKPGEPLAAEARQQVMAAVEEAIAYRRDGPPPIHRPDEHWLQAVIRRDPTLVGVEQPALRELPAWRPRDSPKNWGRGYIDLIGVDGHGDIRIVETKLASNADDLLIFQGLDYLVWATAYQHALRRRLGAPRRARLELHYVVGTDPETATSTLSSCTRPLAAALDPAPVRWRFQLVSDWYNSPDDNRQPHSVTGPLHQVLPGPHAPRMFAVERVDRPEGLDEIDDDTARDLYGEQKEWGFAIPWTYQALASPRAHRPIVRAPRPGDDLWPLALGYWSSLLHLLVYQLGWSNPALGLRWWYDTGKPRTERVLALIGEIWSDDRAHRSSPGVFTDFPHPWGLVNVVVRGGRWWFGGVGLLGRCGRGGGSCRRRG